MQAIICIDDTDNKDSKRGTGELAAQLKGLIEENGWGKSDRIVRHQLFVHPDIPYTSHNSAMSFGLQMENEENIAQIVAFAGAFLTEQSLEGSDPGLCVAHLDSLKETERLIEFGLQAKVEVLKKDHAYQLAEELGIHLSEHGGTGQGVIGALAGAGLRLSGNDGRVRGKHAVTAPQNLVSVDAILRQDGIDLVQTLDGQTLEGRELVRLEEVEKVKSVYLDGRSVVLVRNVEDDGAGAKWEVCPMEYLKKHY
jgi:hypothetical protein